jgi:heat shock protein HspQ
LRITEDSTEIPVDCYFMRKRSAEPALEVADFVMHAVGRQVRHVLLGRNGFVPDFGAVFHNQDPKLSYMHVEKAERRAPSVST